MNSTGAGDDQVESIDQYKYDNKIWLYDIHDPGDQICLSEFASKMTEEWIFQHKFIF